MKVLAIVSALACLGVVLSKPSKRSATWTYHYDAANAIGPDNWGDVDVRCLGDKQSPIDLREDIEVDECIGEVEFHGFGEQPGASMAVENTGHYVEVFLHGDYTVTGAGLTSTYRAEQFHFHWGADDSLGSEHIMNGKAHSAEMHIVTYDTSRFNNVGEGVGQAGGLAVFGFFIDAGDKENPAFDGLLEHFKAIKDPKEEAEIEEALNVIEIMPEDRSEYFRYDGSLTTPSCAEGVIWTVFKHPIMVSHKQMAQYRKLKDEQGAKMVNTFRPVQELNGRTIKSNVC